MEKENLASVCDKKQILHGESSKELEISMFEKKNPVVVSYSCC